MPGSRIGGFLLAALAAGAIASTAAAQSAADPAAPRLRPGPILGSDVSTARSMARPIPNEILVLSRYDEFQRSFARDFGVDLALSLRGDSFGDDFWRRLTARWGDTEFYTWIERAIVMYAQFEAATRIEKKGFDMGVEMDDVAEGKLGVRVSRSLD